MGNLPNITSLRFFLAILVVISHIPEFSANRGFPYYNSMPLFHKGTEAVYMFFSLSGFLIIRNLYLEKFKTGAISLKDFYRRRILRIFPLYYSVLIFGLIYYNFLLPELGFAVEQRQYSLLQGAILGGTFFSNVLANSRPGGILEILWSIGIEEQFYLFVAPLFLLIPSKRIVYFLLFFTVCYFIIYNIEDIDFFRKYKLLFYYFSMSGIIAVLSIKFPDFKVKSAVKGLIFFLFILYFVTDIFAAGTSELTYQLISMILFSVLIFCFVQTPYRFLENSRLKYLGKISYGIYMLHAIVMHFVGLIFMNLHSEILDHHPAIFILIFNLLTLTLTIFVSHFSYRYFESFFLKLKTAKTYTQP